MQRLLSRKIGSYNWLFSFKNESCIRAESTQTQSSTTAAANKKTDLSSSENIIDFDGSKITTKVHHRKKLPAKSPIVKDFFIGKVDKELIPFPEVIERDDMTKLYEDIKNIQVYFKESLDLESINKTRCVSKQTIEDLKNLGCFGLNVPQDYHQHRGKSYSISESLIASESEEISIDVSAILTAHRSIVDIINELGTESQKQKYLPKLADGSLIATSAIYEPTFSENQLFNTVANYEDTEDKWILDGEKSHVLNGIEANLYLVVAQTKKLEISGEPGIGVTIFLVDESTPGLKKSHEIQTIGLRGAKSCNLSFEKVCLSNENVLGQPHEGNEAAQIFLKLHRLRTSLPIFGAMKQTINHMAEFCIKNKQCGVSLQDMDINAKRLSTAISSAYAIESMIYYTAGILDEFEKPDVDVECAITKLFSLETLWSTVKSSLEFLGQSSVLSGEFSEIMLRNTVQLYTGSESIDSLHSFIGLSGLQHAGMNIYENVKKQRNPLFHPGYMFSKFFEQASIDSPKLNLHLEHDLHQSLMPAAQWLELSIGRLQICTDLLLTRHGQDIIQKQIEIRRLSQMVTNCYAMFASLSRSSRSYCIGLQHADYEMLLATTFCLSSRDICKNLAMEIVVGEFVNNDRNYQRLSKQIYKSRGYFSEHPLKYNF